VANLSGEFVKLGHDVTILTFVSSETDSYSINEEIRRVHIAVAKESSNIVTGLYNNLIRVVRLRKTIIDNGYDAVVAMGYTNSVLLALAGLGLDRVFKIGSERTYPPLAPVSIAWRFACKFCYGFLDSFVCLTKQTASWVEINTCAKRVVVIPNGSSYPLQQGEPIVSTDYACKDWKIVFCVGRLIPLKQFDHAIIAFSNVVDKNPNWHLVIAGDGNLLYELKSLSKDLGVEANVHFLKEVGNIGDWLDRSDIFMLTSKREGFPNSLLEAIMHGKPAISYDCLTGPSDIIESGVDGILVPANDLQNLEKSLCSLMNNNHALKTYADMARKKSKEFMIENIAKDWIVEMESTGKEH